MLCTGQIVILGCSPKAFMASAFFGVLKKSLKIFLRFPDIDDPKSPIFLRTNHVENTARTNFTAQIHFPDYLVILFGE